jgi:phosphoribosylglycinamide formyltransferase-1
MSVSKTPIAVLVSGSGSNLQTLIDAAEHPAYPAQIVLVISNRPGVKALDRAASAEIKAVTLDHKAYADRESFERVLHDELVKADVKVVVCAGFMRVLTPWFISQWRGKLINIHPALLPSFKGLNTHARALEAGVGIHGCTVHHVTEGVDEGAIIGQACVAVQRNDTPETLAARVLKQEHRLYPIALSHFLTGQVGPIALFDDETCKQGQQSAIV